MKFVVLFDPTKAKPEDRLITFRRDDPGPIPPIVTPEKPEKAKDGGVPQEEKKPEGPKQR